MRFIFAFFTLYIASLSVAQSRSADADSTTRSTEAQAALNAMSLSLRAVKSGVCVIRCRYTYRQSATGQGKHEDVGENVLIAFDKPQGLYRYDDLEAELVGRPNHTIVRPDMILRAQADWKTSGGSEARGITRRLPSEANNLFQHHRDPFLTTVVDCKSNGIGQTHFGGLDRLLDESLPSAKLVSYNKLESDFVNVKLQRHSSGLNAEIEYDYTLNAVQGYVPERVLLRHTATKTGEWSAPDVIETDWIAMNGTYVPKFTRCSGTEARMSELTFSMVWKSVNEPLDPALFSEEAFDLRKGDMFVVANGDQTVAVEEIVGVEIPKMPLKRSGPPPRSNRLRIVILVHAIVIGVFILLKVRKEPKGK